MSGKGLYRREGAYPRDAVVPAYLRQNSVTTGRILGSLGYDVTGR